MRFGLKRGSDLARAAANVLLETDAERPAGGVASSDGPTDPPAADPPAEDPPAADPPAEDPPAADPPAEDPPEAVATEADVRADQAATERQRVTDVFASDASKGKERLAAHLLANPKLEAADIVAMLPDLGTEASDSMLANLGATPNPKLGAGAEADGATDTAASWDKTFASLGWNK